MRRIVYIFGDYDGSLGEITIRQSSAQPKNLLEANPKLTAHILKLAADPDVMSIYLISFSIRTDPYLDYTNARSNENGSVFQELECYVNALRESTDKVHLDTMMRHDFVLGKTPGFVFDTLKALEWIHLKDYNLVPRELHRWNHDYDELKICLSFLLMWHCHKKRPPGIHLNFQIFDDKPKILEAVSSVLNDSVGLQVTLSNTDFFHYVHEWSPRFPLYSMVKRRDLALENKETHDPPPFDIFKASIRLMHMIELKNQSSDLGTYLRGMTLPMLTHPLGFPVPEHDSPVSLAVKQKQINVLIALMESGHHYKDAKSSIMAYASEINHEKLLSMLESANEDSSSSCSSVVSFKSACETEMDKNVMSPLPKYRWK